MYRWGSMQGGSIAAPDDAAFLSAPCRSSKGGSIILHRQDPGPRQKDDLDDQRSAAMVDSDGGAFPAGWRNEATPCQQPATPEASLLFKAWKTIWLRSPQPRAMHGETKFPCFDDLVEKKANVLTVVRRQQNTKKDGEGGKSWLPTWKNEDGEVLVQKKRPDGFDANKTNVEIDQVELVGELTMTHRMTDATWRAAIARNIM